MTDVQLTLPDNVQLAVQPMADKPYIILMAGLVGLDPTIKEVVELEENKYTKGELSLKLVAIKDEVTKSKKLSKDQVDRLKAMVDIRNSHKYRVLTSKQDECVNNANHYAREMENYLVQAAKAREELNIILNIKPDLTEEIEKILASGFYEISAIYSDYVRFVTLPVTLVENNPAAGVKRSVFLGKFYVTYKPNINEIKVTPFSDSNIKSSSYYHPHVSSSGSVCWGTASELYSSSLSKYEPSKALTALQVILCNYNGNSPYRDIGYFMGNAAAGTTTQVQSEIGRAHV
jgi:hypothetical protein